MDHPKQSLSTTPPGRRIPKKLFVAAGACLVLIGVSLGVYFNLNTGNGTEEKNGPYGNGDNNGDSNNNNNNNNNNDNGDNSNGTYEYQTVGCIQTPVTSLFDTQPSIYQNIITKQDILYGKGTISNGEKDLELDIYHPDFGNKVTQKYPLMIHIHGGSFTSGSKSDGYIKSLSEHWAHLGYVVASINYRLAGDAPIVSTKMEPVLNYVKIHLSEVLKSETQAQAATCAVEDTVTAYEYMKNLEYVDENTVIMNGYSAGAITSLWASYGLDYFDIDRPPVKAVLSHWGMLVVDREETKNLVPNNNEPPVFLVHATGDSIVPYDGTQYLANRMQSLGMPYALHCQDSGSHSISIDSAKHSNELSILDAEQIWLRNILEGK